MPGTLRNSACAALAIVAVLSPFTAAAEDGWNPFAAKDRSREEERSKPTAPTSAPPPVLTPMDGVSSRPWAHPSGTSGGPGATGSPWAPNQTSNSPWGTPSNTGGSSGVEVRPLAPLAPVDRVERAELSKPVMAADGSGWSDNLWAGLDLDSAQDLIAHANVPPHSAALHALWRRLWSTNSSGIASKGGKGPSFAAVRLEVLYRSGLMADMKLAMQTPPIGEAGPIERLLRARGLIASGDRASGCAEIKSVHRAQSKLPKPMRSEFLLLAGLCGTGDGDPSAAGLAADLIRAERVDAPVALAALDAIAAKKPLRSRFALPKKLSLLEYRYLELAKWPASPDMVTVAEPALLWTLATSNVDPETRILAAEAAARIHALSSADLADVYRSHVAPPAALADPFSARLPPPLQRALLFKAAEAERTPLKKARLARALLDEARRADIHFAAAAMLARPVRTMLPSPEMNWFAETAIESNLAAGKYDVLEFWASPPRGERHPGYQHWLVLADIADTKWRRPRGAQFVEAEAFAARGRLAPELMHRLVTVLDALDYQIPIPLWEAASRTPQPTTGHLPETGILSQLQDASKKKEFARTVLLAMRTLGPDTGATANMIALGDTIKALKRAGLEADARRLGLEAVFPGWPRSANN